MTPRLLRWEGRLPPGAFDPQEERPSPPLPPAPLLLPLLRFSYQFTFQIGLQPVTLLEKMIM